MSNQYLNLLEMPRLIKRPFRLRNMAWQENHVYYSRQRVLTVPHFCCTLQILQPGIYRSLINGELHESTDTQPFLNIFPAGTTLHTLNGRRSNELYFTVPAEDFDTIMNTFKPLTGKFTLNRHINSVLNEIFANIKNIYLPGAADRMDGLFIRFIEEVSLAIANQRFDPGEDPVIYEIVSYINSNFQKNITLDDICRKYSISLRTLYRKWNKCFKHTPADFMLQKRLDYAKKMLLFTDLPIKTIALNSGFNNPFYFSQCFQRCCKQSPGQYRKKQHSEEDV